MASYRKTLASGFVYKFWHDIAKNIGILSKAEIADADSFINIVERDVSRGVQSVGNPEYVIISVHMVELGIGLHTISFSFLLF